MKKTMTNEERHFSVDELVRRDLARLKRRMKGGQSLINWTVPHHLSKYHTELKQDNQDNTYYWIRHGEDYYIAVDRIKEEEEIKYWSSITTL